MGCFEDKSIGPVSQPPPGLNVQPSDGKKTESPPLKIIVIGSQHVGKTLFLKSFLRKEDSGELSNTPGVDYHPAEIVIKGKKHALGLWDTSGQENFRALTSSYYREAEGVFLLYDIINNKSFIELKDVWLAEVKEKNPETFRVVIANKQDLRDQAVVENAKAEAWCKDNGLDWFGTSAQRGDNVQQSFEFMVTKILERKEKKALQTR